MALLETLGETLKNINVIIGLILAILGLAVLLLARKITKKIRKEKNIEKMDNLYLIIMAFALVLVVAGLIITVFR
ncbi:MAG: hypothetical protein RR140_02840 [Clostridia bacterium]